MDTDAVLQTGWNMTDQEMDWEEELDDLPQAQLEINEEDEEDSADEEEEINWDDEDLG